MFSSDGTLISTSAAPHCGAKFGNKKLSGAEDIVQTNPGTRTDGQKGAYGHSDSVDRNPYGGRGVLELNPTGPLATGL